jgi:hypothetical protein
MEPKFHLTHVRASSRLFRTPLGNRRTPSPGSPVPEVHGPPDSRATGLLAIQIGSTKMLAAWKHRRISASDADHTVKPFPSQLICGVCPHPGECRPWLRGTCQGKGGSWPDLFRDHGNAARYLARRVDRVILPLWPGVRRRLR